MSDHPRTLKHKVILQEKRSTGQDEETQKGNAGPPRGNTRPKFGTGPQASGLKLQASSTLHTATTKKSERRMAYYIKGN